MGVTPTKHDSALLAVRSGGRLLLRPFATMSSSGTNIPYLDSLRGVAVLLVVVFHFWLGAGKPTVGFSFLGAHVDLTPLFASGFVGVNLFFVLSGFLLSQVFLRADFRGRPRPSLRIFFRHRLFRIVPGYYCCLFLTILFLCPGFINPNLVYSPEGAVAIELHMLFLQSLLPSGLMFNPALWTLTLEMMFYLALPFIMPLFLRTRWLAGMAACVMLSCLYAVAGAHTPQAIMRLLLNGYGAIFPQTRFPGIINAYTIRAIIETQLPSYLFQFCFGIVVANLFTREQVLGRDRRWLRVATSHIAGTGYIVVGMALTLWSMRALGQRYIAGPPVVYPSFAEAPVTLGFTLILAGLLWAGERIRTVASFVPLRIVGVISYSIYLWHLPILFVTLRLPTVAASVGGARFRLIMWHASLMVLAVSILFYLVIEKPFIALGRGSTGVPGMRPSPPLATDWSPAVSVDTERATVHD